MNGYSKLAKSLVKGIMTWVDTYRGWGIREDTGLYEVGGTG